MASLMQLRQATKSILSPSTSLAVRSFASTSKALADVPSTTEPAPTAISKREPGEIAQAGVVSGAPDEIHRRPVRIYRPAPPSTQSAKIQSHVWRIDWDILQGAGRWENPLMGWASSADYMQGTNLKFNTKEDAIHFCEKQGYPFFVQEPNAAKFKPKSYAANYLYNPKKIRLVTTK